MSTFASRLRRTTSGDTGMGLSEVLIAAFLGLLIMIMLGNLFGAVVKGTNTAALADKNTRPAATAMSLMTRYFHAATTYPVTTQTSPLPAFDTAKPTEVVFYAYVNLQDTTATPLKVRYYLDGNKNLVQQIWKANAPVNGYYTFSSTSTSMVIGGPVASPTVDGDPLFTFLNSGGDPVTDTAAISSVEVNLELGSTTPGAGGNAHLSSVIALLNVGQAGAYDAS
ncbi:MAG: hypothetical protein INR66_24455 [Gordonia polyisoprenivorans]|nr:hypothetical protein [Gordonia polyisoprenivorans]